MIQAQSDYKSNFLKKWDNAAAYTIECAEAMPEDKYDYKPTPESRTFKGQLLHMVSNMMWLSTEYLEGVAYHENLKEIDPSKDQMLTILRETFKLSRQAVEDLPDHKMRDVVNFFAGPMEIQQIMMLMTDHMTHHRGQILVYMRMNDVKAPKYRGW
ncbi:hypothetical protein GCM10007940_19040 [Portibacter lacus]|uniref:DinB family protein n=2 Tax=Portibacter lacus TaxID=1099794 RepID=A0AA37SQ77_9BACT|nr:hypothetical protein GCM10007940_19040 [Portibacter lacus]